MWFATPVECSVGNSNRLGLVVKLDKANSIVFRNNNYVASWETGMHGQNVMKTVNVYKYLQPPRWPCG